MSAPEHRYGLRQPCRNCPFRKDVEPYIRHGRAQEIAAGIRQGGEFACHTTTVNATDDEGNDVRVDGARSRVCAGSLAVMVNEGSLNQMARIAERVGAFDPSKLNTSTAYGSMFEFVRAHRVQDDRPMATHPETGERLPMQHCEVVDDDCEDPAGYGSSGGAYENPEEPTCDPFTDECEGCGKTACESCRSPEWGPDGRWCSICWNPDED